MQFGSWLNHNVSKSKRLPEQSRNNQTLTLSDPDGRDSACIQLLEVPTSVSVVIPQQIGQWELFDPGPSNWRKRCDYILMGEVDDYYFAILIELKTNAPDTDGDNQLKWSLPIFHYLLSVYCTDVHSSKWNKRLKIKYFQFGKNVYRLHQNLTRVDPENFFEMQGGNEINILYSDSTLFSLNQLLRADVE